MGAPRQPMVFHLIIHASTISGIENNNVIFFLLLKKKVRIRMDLSHLAVMQYKQGKHHMNILYIKKKKDKKGFLLMEKDGKIEDIQSMYPIDAASFFDSNGNKLFKAKKRWDYTEDDEKKLKEFVLFEKLGGNVFPENTIMNRIKQRLL